MAIEKLLYARHFAVFAQYTLSEETISYLKQPTFDIWHWETNEVSVSNNDKLYTMSQKRDH